MPITEVELPNGEIVEVEHDEGMSDDAILKEVSLEQKVGDVESGGRGRTILDQSLQGATFGFADEITDRLGAGIASVLTDEDYSSLLEEARRMSSKRMKSQQEDFPVTSIISGGAGALLTGAAGATTKAGQALVGSIGRSGAAGRVAKSAGVGAATGAVAGFGAGEGGVEERLQSAQEGAVLGGAVGGAIPAIPSIARGARGAFTSAREGARAAAKGRDADAIVAKVLTDVDPKDATKALSDEGSALSLVDIAGDEAQGLLRSTAKKIGGTKNAVADFLEGRSEEAGVRINDLLSKKVSNVDNYFQSLDDLNKARQAAAIPLYKAATTKGASLKPTKRLNTLLNDPRVDRAINEGKSRFGVSAEANRLSVATLDGAKKAIDDDIGELVRKGRSNEARQLIELKNDLVAQVDKQVPEYKKARQVFSGFKASEDAQEQGLNFLREDPELIKRTIDGLSPSEHDAYLIGVRRALKNQIDRTADSGDPAKKIFGNKLVRDRIEAAFPDKDSFTEFSKRMFDEIKAADTKFKVLGGSRSDFNLTQDASLMIDTLETAATQGRAGLRDQVFDTVFTGVKNRMLGLTDKNAKEVADILMDKTKGIEALERLAKKNNPLQAEVINEFIPDFRTIRNQQVGITTGSQSLARED